MPRIVYQEKNFSKSSLETIKWAVDICAAYARQGYTLTLRQLYYQGVSRDLVPNRQAEYDRLGGIIADARLAGLIDWDWLEDRGRSVNEVSHWESPDSILGAVASEYRIDKWETQPRRPMVCIEKDALSGVFEPICRELDIPLFACKGYPSASALWRIGRGRLKQYIKAGQRPVVLHFGDHDPSGIQMTEDLQDRLSLFAEARVEVRRLALNMDQIRQYNPPPNPAKLTDSRAAAYIERFGSQSWELDALNPETLAALVRGAIENIRDSVRWADALGEEQADRTRLQSLSDDWMPVKRFLDSRKGVDEDLDEDGNPPARDDEDEDADEDA